jgi:hydroxyacylglutathione hydrolase
VLLEPKLTPAQVARIDTPEQLSEARLRLARVGIEAERGYLDGGVAGWKRAGFDLATLREISVQELQLQLSGNRMRVLDVRREAEWTAGHVDGATWWPLDRFRVAPPEVDLNFPLAVHCQSGYRSIIACSLLQCAGFQNVMNVRGGFGAWQQAKLPVANGSPVET